MRVGVFVNAEEAFVASGLTECMLNILHSHGDETPEECSRYP